MTCGVVNVLSDYTIEMENIRNYINSIFFVFPENFLYIMKSSTLIGRNYFKSKQRKGKVLLIAETLHQTTSKFSGRIKF